jgi:predicted GIY-YIG superfamily endonuclease
VFWLYILRCGNGSYYVGHTDDLDKRMGSHAQGEGSVHTARFLAAELVYCVEFATRDEAFLRERQVKGWSRAKKEALIRRDWDKLRELARGPDQRR